MQTTPNGVAGYDYIEEGETPHFDEVASNSLGLPKLALSVWHTLHFHPKQRESIVHAPAQSSATQGKRPQQDNQFLILFGRQQLK